VHIREDPATGLVRIDPPKTWGVRSTDGPIRAAVEVMVEPVAGSWEARKEMPENMAALKQKVEAGQGLSTSAS
jgi:hypothetical protein